LSFAIEVLKNIILEFGLTLYHHSLKQVSVREETLQMVKIGLAIEELMRCNLVFYALLILALLFKKFRYKVAQTLKASLLSKEF